MAKTTLRDVSIVGISQIPVQKQSPQSLRQMGAEAVRRPMASANVDRVDGLFAGNMLSDELQNQKHIARLSAGEAGLRGVEALQVGRPQLPAQSPAARPPGRGRRRGKDE